MAKIEIPDEFIPENAKLIEAYETDKEVIVIGEPEWVEDHNCDQMGCGTLSHVIYRLRHKLSRNETSILRSHEQLLKEIQEKYDRDHPPANGAIRFTK